MTAFLQSIQRRAFNHFMHTTTSIFFDVFVLYYMVYFLFYKF